MEIREIKVKSILGKSSICDYCINPYVGCEHACIYCYADYYTKKISKHKEEWGSFVDIKINADSILKKEIKKIKPSSVWISSLTDPYQPLELKYEITKKCIEILLKNDFFIIIQTKSSNVIRDLEIFKKYKNNVEIVFTITMLEENFRKIFAAIFIF